MVISCTTLTLGVFIIHYNMSMPSRNHAIDILRGSSILIIIFLHIAPYYLKFPWVALIWSWAQFVVPVILLCSVAVTRIPSGPFELSRYLMHIGKRLKRLLIPYYVFFVAYTAITYWFQPHKLTWWYFFQNNTLTGGIDFQWLVLLFILLAILSPLTDRLYIGNRKAFFVLIGISLGLSCIYQFNRPWWNANYRLWMIGSWLSIVLIARWIIDLFTDRRWADLAGIILGSLCLWVIILFALVSQHIQIATYYHKYPPDIYHITYAIWTMVTLYIVVSQLVRLAGTGKFLNRLIMPWMRWCSTYSYELFFTHIIIITLLDLSFPRRNISIWMFGLLTYAPTILIVILINLLKSIPVMSSRKA